MDGPFCVHGVPVAAWCRECEEQARHANDDVALIPVEGEWRQGQVEFERWLDRIGGSA